ncbi:hypothetical protein CRE_23053 [Caenorhabditis remanei]|uniref:Sdz-33 F-box domain-containing protein n=1 Tax=Caenorhabditis remanei TaxID=31234 RepID=E3N9D9_CAERE|nr:hypothetical protein CRE_23053 [Caenorhabditis remanei]
MFKAGAIRRGDSNDENGELPADITLPVAATFEYLYTKVQLTTPLLNFNKWLDHIRTVFCCTPPANIRFYRGSERFDIGSLKETIGNVNWLYMFGQSTDIHYKHILKYFNTPNKLFLDRNPFEIASEIQQFFIQNYETVRFYCVYSLDDMLLVNSEKVRFTHSISQKQFNQFIKHWIRGSNPRLQSMSLSIDKTDFVSGIVHLNGVRFMEMSEDAKREIRQNHRLTNLDMVQIRRKDGTPAVIATNDGDHRLHINLIVLH